MRFNVSSLLVRMDDPQSSIRAYDHEADALGELPSVLELTAPRQPRRAPPVPSSQSSNIASAPHPTSAPHRFHHHACRTA